MTAVIVKINNRREGVNTKFLWPRRHRIRKSMSIYFNTIEVVITKSSGSNSLISLWYLIENSPNLKMINLHQPSSSHYICFKLSNLRNLTLTLKHCKVNCLTSTMYGRATKSLCFSNKTQLLSWVCRLILNAQKASNITGQDWQILTNK